MDPTHLAAVLIRAHARRSLTPLCRCSPTVPPTDDRAIVWTPTHVAEHLAQAGLLIHLPAHPVLDLDATGPTPALQPTPRAPGRTGRHQHP